MGEDAGAGRDRPDERRPPQREEVTLADLLVTIWDHRLAAVAVFLVVLLGTVGYTWYAGLTAPQPINEPDTPLQERPRYHGTASVLIVNEEDVVRHVIGSRRFAADVADKLDLMGGELGSDRDQVTTRLMENTTMESSGRRPTLLTVTVNLTDPQLAAEAANTYVSTLEDWRPFMENITRDRLWPTYLQRYNFNETRAEENLTAFLESLTFFRPLDEAQPPEKPAWRPAEARTDATPTEPAGPSMGLNLALGATMGLLLGLLAPFGLEAYGNVRQEIRRRRGR